MGVRALASALVDLVLPAECAGCGEPVAPVDGPWCSRCRTRLGDQRRPLLAGLPPVFAAARYTGPPRDALLRYKERGRRDLAAPLADRLGAVLDPLLVALAETPPWALAETPPWALAETPPGVLPAPPPAVTWLVPAPSRPAAARARGGDHVVRLCRALAADRPHLRVAPALRLAGAARDSVGLDAAQRAVNLAGKLRVLPARVPPAGATVVLVDDVVTTGATLRACCAALAGAGIRVTAAVALCDATPHK